MRQRKYRSDQQGIASIMITMIMMLVITLIVLAFAQASRSAQRQALDNQLSNQAYYAAETGINDAIQKIKAELASSGTVSTDNSCASAVLSSTDNVSYTCVKIDSEPAQLTGTTTSSTGKVFRIRTAQPVSSITVTWNKTGNGSLGSCPTTVGGAAGDQFSKASLWTCPFGVLRFDLTQTSGILGPTPLTRDNLIAHTYSGFVVPLRSGFAVSGQNVPVYFFLNDTNRSNNRLAPTSCDANTCSITFKGLIPGGEYYLNTRLMYASQAAVTVTAQNNTKFVGSQVQIDATGKAQDVLRRVKVSMNLFSSSTASGTGMDNMAIQSGDGPCKQQFISNDSYQNQGLCSDTL